MYGNSELCDWSIQLLFEASTIITTSALFRTMPMERCHAGCSIFSGFVLLKYKNGDCFLPGPVMAGSVASTPAAFVAERFRAFSMYHVTIPKPSACCCPSL